MHLKSLNRDRLKQLTSINPAKNPALRVGLRTLSQYKRRGARLYDRFHGERRQNPPILCNSIPKSGTNLLLQVIRKYPGVRYFDTIIMDDGFWQSNSRTDAPLIADILELLPQECAPAHIHYSDAIASAIRDRKGLHFFMIRDPRDVLVSNLHFITRMAYWHPLHQDLSAMANDSERLMALINGFTFAGSREFPDVGQRLGAYLGWLQDADTCVVRFEDMVGPNVTTTLRTLDSYFLSRASWVQNLDGFHSEFDPTSSKSSKTFRSGKSGEWRTHFLPEHLESLQKVAGDAMQRLGYSFN